MAEKKLKISEPTLRMWIRLRATWFMNITAFSNALSQLSVTQQEELYEVVRHAAYKDSYVKAIQAYPQLKPIIKNDNDLIIAYEIYRNLSWKLGKSENAPKEYQIVANLKSRLPQRSGYWY